LYAILAERARGPERWQHLLALFVIQSVVCCLAPLVAILLIGIMAYDLFERSQFSWLHWTGAVVCLWQSLTGALLYPGGAWAVLLGAN
jgi:hypothetical protein